LISSKPGIDDVLTRLDSNRGLLEIAARREGTSALAGEDHNEDIVVLVGLLECLGQRVHQLAVERVHGLRPPHRDVGLFVPHLVGENLGLGYRHDASSISIPFLS
jgi:hypothetical protein